MWKMGVRTLVCSLMLLLWFIPALTGYAEGEGQANLIHNGGFEDAESGIPSSWTQDVWVQDVGVTLFTIETKDVHSGKAAVVIENKQPNHSKWVQKIAVNPNAYYHITGWIKVSGASDAASGANIFIAGVQGAFPQFKNTEGEWKQVEFYGQTASDQKELQLAASLGGYGSLNTGRALFDDFSMVEVDSVPNGVEVISFKPYDAAAGTEAKQDNPAQVSAFPVLAVSALFAVLFFVVYNRALRQRHPLEKVSSRDRNPVVMGWLLVALGFRVVVATAYPGYISDMNTFMYWANDVYVNGISNFYREGVFADYPPGYIYVLYVLKMLQSMLDLDYTTNAARLLFKLPAMLADLAAGWFIYQSAKKKLGASAAIGLMLLYVWNPAIWIDSAAWGQVDSVFTLFLVLAIHAVVGNRFERGALWYAIAVLIKPQALIFMPVILLAVWHKREWKRSAISALYGIAVFIALAMPFFWNNGGIAGLINLYKTTLSSYAYATLNAFNLYSLTGGNWTPLETKWMFLSYGTWGSMAIVLAVIAAVFLSLRGKHKQDLSKSFFIGLVLIAIVFLLGTKMHERYLFPAILLLVFAYIQAQDRRILHLLLGFSVTLFINVGYALAFSSFTTDIPADGIVLLTSIINLGLLIYTLYIGYDIYVRDRQVLVEPITDDERRDSDEQLLAEVHVTRSSTSTSSLKLYKKDWIWMSGITLVYAVVALFNLGSTQSMDSGWRPDKVAQSFYVDFGEPQKLEKMNSFGGVGTGKYKLEFAADPNQWVKPLEIEQVGGDNLKWKSHNLDVEARYARITVVTTGFSIQEMVFYKQGSDQPVAINEIVGGDAEASGSANTSGRHLFDEQSAAAYKADYLNGSYFDEIYHARTAYEHLEGIKAYENTHPPLGKILIALGIKLFGLSPFGWRIVGTLFGIAMVPLMYLFALRLFRKTGYATAAAGLFAAEFMHFTQTRIATIDVYGVFFIILMFFFMQRYYSLNFYQTALRKTLIPLFWAGLFFGIGVASKWIVLYGGAGLAVMLGISLYERYRQYAAAKRALATGTVKGDILEAYQRVTKLFVRNTMITLASCIMFFVVIPLAIYGLSYIPVLSVEGDHYSGERLVEYQKHMFSYHSELVATHPYSSQWWEWPFMKRPVWYYSGQDLANPNHISGITVFGNPLIWWIGIFAFIGALYMSIKRKDKQMYVIWIAYLSQYLPWMLVPRLTFIYHYFAMVPFMIMAIVYMFKLNEDKRPHQSWIRWLFVSAAALLFMLYYPVLSGMEVSRAYASVLRLFDSWVFFS
ncbi:MAG: phospholipid carrier-dependent glycosyltransferase [Candidatus Pristimantibacillus sp.]